MDSMKKRDMDYCSYNLGGFIGTLPEHAARQGIAATTVRARKNRGWKLSEALGYVKREVGASAKLAPTRLAIEEKYQKPFDEVLADLQRQGVSINSAAKTIGYDPKALYRYLDARPKSNPWIGKMYSPVAEKFHKAKGVTVAQWLKTNAKKYTRTEASHFIGYAAVATFNTYLRKNSLKPEFRKQGKPRLHRGKSMNLQDHARNAGIAIGTVSARMHRGMTLHQALTTPVVPRPWMKRDDQVAY